MKPTKVAIHFGSTQPQPTRDSSAIGSGFRLKLRTANDAGQEEMKLSAVICTANIAGAASGEWALIAPYGNHAAPDGSYVQRFSREQAEAVVRTWNSITGKAARIFKNLWHGMGSKSSLPVWDGHPETDKQRWPKEKLLGEITELRTGNDGLEGRIMWTDNAERPRGPLFPSPLWWHWPPAASKEGGPLEVFPELLESIGLVPTPNISGVPAWTANATLAGDPQADGDEPQQHDTERTQNIMDKKKLIALLGLAEDATDEQIETALKTANAAVEQLQTANTAKADVETQLATANSQVTALTTERDGLKTTNAALTTQAETLRKGVLDIAEKKGAISPAEREAFNDRLATANTAAAALTELQTRKGLNTAPVEINGNRMDLSTANARQSALNDAVSKRMKENKEDYDTAFAAIRKDQNFAPLFDAM